MKTEKTNIDGVLLIFPYVYEDFRGEYIEIYNEQNYKDNGINIGFIQDDISLSYKNVLRGIHGDFKTWKLVSCLFGRFYLVVVDCREGTNFGKWWAITLSDKNRAQVLIPPGCGNAHLILSDMAIFHYKQSTYYDRDNQFTYSWKDSKFNIFWPIDDPVLSKRDSS